MSRGWPFPVLLAVLATALFAQPHAAAAVELANGQPLSPTGPPVPTRVAPPPGPGATPPPPALAPAIRTYQSTALGFRLAYPANWVPAGAAAPGVEDFSTRGAGAPLEMAASDVWLTVDASRPPAACGAPPAGVKAGQVPVNLNGSPSSLQLIDPVPGSVEPTWKAFSSVAAGQRCYELWFVTLSAQTRALQLNTMRAIIASFEPLAPAPAVPPPPSSSDHSPR